VRRKAKHLFTLAYARCRSTTTALQALRFCIEYGRMTDDVRRTEEIRMDEYAEHVGVSLAQAYRRRAAYRTCFPNQDVMHLWHEVVRPNLDNSSFKDEPPAAQAVFAGSLVIELSA